MPNTRLECKKNPQFEIKMANIDTLFMTERLKNHILKGCTYLYDPYREVPPAH